MITFPEDVLYVMSKRTDCLGPEVVDTSLAVLWWQLGRDDTKELNFSGSTSTLYYGEISFYS